MTVESLLSGLPVHQKYNVGLLYHIDDTYIRW